MLIVVTPLYPTEKIEQTEKVICLTEREISLFVQLVLREVLQGMTDIFSSESENKSSEMDELKQKLEQKLGWQDL